MKVKLIASTDIGELICGIAARTCVSETCPGTDDPEKSMKSLKQALNSHHESVLEHWSATFAIEGISRACSHQLVRHRLMSASQQSQRYVRMAYSSRDLFDYVTPDSIKGNSEAMELFARHMRATAEVYGRLVDCYGIPMEDARYILPNACCTNIVVTMNARELRHFLGERLCTRAQWEIREMAEKMLEAVQEVAPVLFEDVGPKCQRLGYCPERKGCGRMMPKEERE